MIATALEFAEGSACKRRLRVGDETGRVPVNTEQETGLLLLDDRYSARGVNGSVSQRT